MSAMPEDTRQSIAESVRRSWESHAVRARRVAGLRKSFTPARRAAIGKERRAFWRRWQQWELC